MSRRHTQERHIHSQRGRRGEERRSSSKVRLQKLLRDTGLKDTWLITDLHFNHAGIIGLCGRPQNYETRIVKHWKRLVKPQDTVVCLGDVCIGNDAFVHEEYIAKLPGVKILVRGNHDKRSDHWYEEHGWNFVCDQVLLDRFGHKILLTHKPAACSWNHFDTNIHGHQHNTLSKDFTPDKIRFLLALEYENYSPVLLQSFMHRIEKIRKV